MRQGLYTSRQKAEAASVLLRMSVAMLLGFLFVATCTTALARRGITPKMQFMAGVVLALLGQLGLVLEWLPPVWLWSMLGMAFSFSNIAYPQLTAHFDKALSGRVNSALNLVVFLGAFGLQWGMGVLVDWFNFRNSFTILLVAQSLAFVWFLVPLPHAYHKK